MYARVCVTQKWCDARRAATIGQTVRVRCSHVTAAYFFCCVRYCRRAYCGLFSLCVCVCVVKAPPVARVRVCGDF